MNCKQDIFSVLRGQAPAKMPFSPEMLVWYRWNRNAGTLPAKYKDASLVEICADLDITMLPLYYCGEHEDLNELMVSETDSDNTHGCLIETPFGKARATWKVHQHENQDPEYWMEECPLKTIDDIEVIKYYCNNRQLKVAGQDKDYGDFLTFEKKLDDRGLIRVNLPRVSVMRFLIELSNYMDGTYLIYDHPDKVEELFNIIEEADDSVYETAGNHPSSIFNLGDNIDRTLSPDLFKKYCVPHYQKRTAQLHEKSKICFCHMDGDIKHILEMLPETGIDCIDGMPLAPMSDMTPADVEYLVSRGVCVFGVLPAALFLPSGSLELLEQEVRELKEVYQNHGGIILGASDEFPPDGELDRIKLVQDILNE